VSLALLKQVKKAWNAFTSNEQTKVSSHESYGPSSSQLPQRRSFGILNDKTIVTSVYNRMAIDVASLDIRHIMLDESGRYLDDKDSRLNKCLTFQPNIDQGPRAIRQDAATTMFDKGVVAIVPVDTVRYEDDPLGFDIESLRIGEVVQFYPKHVRVSVWNEAKGIREEVTLEKRFVAIAQNPFYAIMNEPNSTLQRLIRKLQLLDVVDEQSGSGKLDIIIQLPYIVKSKARQEQAEKRREDLEFQLKNSQYGIAYTEASEKIIQLNRPAENNLLAQVTYLTNLLYSQLGLTEEIMNGTADEATMLNYFNRTIKPIIDSIVEAMQRAFLGTMGTHEKEQIKYFRDPFALVPVGQIAEIADKFTRNEVLTSNEIRGFIGVRPSKDPKADQLVNSNMPQSTEDKAS
jgi:hypothetical protein